MKCPKCQHENTVEAKFCEECAAPLACANCGSGVSSTARFCPQCGHPLKPLADDPRFASPKHYTPQHLADKILTSRVALEGERKQVTVLFADIKSSMELLADLDPEDAQKLLEPVIERMIEAVHRYEGTVNKVMGDGIMALFGAPLAHEDHAVRACYAALRMQETVTRYADDVQRSHAIPVMIRVGLNSGDIVVRAIGNDLHMDYTVIGQTLHLASRMEQMAKPGSVLITANTLQLAEGYVSIRSLGPAPVKGLAVPLQIYEVTGAGHARTRLQAALGRGLTRFPAATSSSRNSAGPSSLPAAVAVRLWRSSAKQGWASRAWCTNSFIPTTQRTGWFWKPAPFPMVKRRLTCRSSSC
jgi:class 3 adenylate cyclase